MSRYTALAEFYLQRKAALVVLLLEQKRCQRWIKRRSWQVMEYRKNYIAEIVTGEETVGASMGLSASVEISTREPSRPLAMLDSELLGGFSKGCGGESSDLICLLAH